MLLWKSITRCPEVRLRARGIALDEPGETMTFCPSDFRPHRLSVRTGDSQSSKRGSIPRGGTTFRHLPARQVIFLRPYGPHLPLPAAPLPTSEPPAALR